MSDAALTPVTLQGHEVRLEPLTLHHVDDLVAAASEDRSTYAFTHVPDGRDAMARYVTAALADHAAGRSLPFAVRRVASRTIVGTTRFLDLQRFAWPPEGPGTTRTSDASPPTVAEIGNTWYAASAQRTTVNTDCKVVMLQHAFETWQTIRVTLKTDARNLRSRAAILRLGAAFEGVRRRHLPVPGGAVRDTAYYSIVAEEWPAVRSSLLARLQRTDAAS